MKITIDTDVLQRHHLTIGQFLVLLIGYFKTSYWHDFNDLIQDSIADINQLTDDNSVILSDNSRNLVARIITESSPKLSQSPVKDFEALAQKLMDIYPEGNKPGTTYPWRGTIEETAQKLRVLVVEHDFVFTEEEAVNAVKQYVDSFKEDNSHMKLLKYFLLRTKDKEISSDFMTMIENNRDENK